MTRRSVRCSYPLSMLLTSCESTNCDSGFRHVRIDQERVLAPSGESALADTPMQPGSENAGAQYHSKWEGHNSCGG